MKNIYIILLCLSLGTTSCDWASDKAKKTVNKTGEIVAKTGSEFADGVAKGVEKTFQNEVQISDELKNQGIKTGKVVINSTDTTTDNIITAYIIFDKNFSDEMMLKVYDEQGSEYGRTKKLISGKKGEASYVDFVFDKRTNIDGKVKIRFE